jgi:hypothetical protein
MSANSRAPKRAATTPSPTGESTEFDLDTVVTALEKDRRLAQVASAYRTQPARGGSRRFGSRSLRVDGRIFAMVVAGRLVVKLPRARVDELIAAGQCTPFDPGHGRLMKEWAAIASEKVAWRDLVYEAYEFVSGQNLEANRRRS